jgi:hypothetical protein
VVAGGKLTSIFGWSANFGTDCGGGTNPHTTSASKSGQTACKPGSVLAPGEPGAMDGHSSGTPVTERLARPTRAAARKRRVPVARRAAPIWSCSRWGLPCRSRCRSRGGLLPHPFTLTCPATPRRGAGPAVCSLWHFPWGRPRRPLTGTVSPWSPDFPRPAVAREAQPSSRLTRAPD